MKTSTWFFSLALVAATPAIASDKVELYWNQLPYYIEGHQVTVSADNLTPVKGKCVRVDYDGLLFANSQGGRPLRLERRKVQHIKVAGAGGRQMTRLVERAGPELDRGRQDIFSPKMPAGLVRTPIVAAYMIAATPFCLIGDLFALLKPSLEIDVVEKNGQIQ